MRIVAVVLCGVGVGCAQPATIDEACPEHLRGERRLAPEPTEMLLRISCHRRFVGLAPINVQAGVQEQVALHAQYLEENGIFDPASPNYGAHDPFGESPQLQFFTGADVYQRLERTQAIDMTADLQIWQIFLGRDQADADELFDLPWVRDPLFQPRLVGGGYAELTSGGADHMYMTLVYTFPPATRMDRPVVWPREGQVDVPTTWIPPSWWLSASDPLIVGGGRGYPISITVGSYEGNPWAENPYGLTGFTHHLEDEHGVEIPLVFAGPGKYAWGDNNATVVYMPTLPLLPDTTYFFEAEIGWNAHPTKTVVTSFTTVSDGVPGTL